MMDLFPFILLPNKLITMIKHPKNLYYDKVFLSSNPFPSIIAFNKKYNELVSYSLSGIKIKAFPIDNKSNSEIKIESIFNIYGGIFEDMIKIDFKENFEIYTVPFFEEYKI